MKLKCSVGAEIFLSLYTISYYLHSIGVPLITALHGCERKFNSSICNQVNCNETVNQQCYYSDKELKSQVSIWMSAILSAQFLPSIIFLLIWGPFVDYVGTRRAMLIPPVIQLFQALYYIMFSCFGTAHPLYLMFGSCLTSLFGDFSGCATVAYAFIAETNSIADRSKRMAILESSFILSGISAGLSGAVIINQFGLKGLFCLSFILCVLNTCHSIYLNISQPKATLVVESKSPEKQPPDLSNIKTHYFNFLQAMNPIRTFSRIKQVVWHSPSRNEIFLIFMIYFFIVLATSGEVSLSVLYLKGKPLSFTSTEISILLAYVSLVRGVGVIVSSIIFLRWCKIQDSIVLCIGIASLCSTYLLVSFAKTQSMAFLASLSGVCGVMAIVMCRSIVSKLADDNVATVLASLEVIAAIGGSTIAMVSTLVYSENTSIFPGNIFHLFAIMTSIALCLAIYFNLRKKFIRRDNSTIDEKQSLIHNTNL